MNLFENFTSHYIDSVSRWLGIRYRNFIRFRVHLSLHPREHTYSEKNCCVFNDLDDGDDIALLLLLLLLFAVGREDVEEAIVLILERCCGGSDMDVDACCCWCCWIY